MSLNPAVFYNNLSIDSNICDFLLLAIRPQQKGTKNAKICVKYKRRDDIITIGGIYGRVLNIKDDVVTLEIGDKLKIKVNRSAIGNVLKRAEESE